MKKLKYDSARAVYVGLNKVRSYYTAGRHKIPDVSIKASAAATGTASGSLAAFIGKVAGSAETSRTLQTLEVTDIAERSQLLAIAPQIFEELLSTASIVPPPSNYEVGRTYKYVGPARYRLRTDDDFRKEGAHEDARRLGLWLIEILDDNEPGSEETVTWIVLSGTAQGQIKDDLGGSVSDWRAGSDTAGLFNLMHAKTNGTEPSQSGAYMLRDPYFALAARNMLRESSEQTVELAFSCLQVKDCCTKGEEATVSMDGWSPASAGREIPVSRVVVGTPYFVQLARPAKRSLMRQLRAYLGFDQAPYSRKLR